MSSPIDRKLFINHLSKAFDSGSKLDVKLERLPAYAGYLHKHKLKEFAEWQFALSRKFRLPILKLSGLTNEGNTLALFESGVSRMLSALAVDSTSQYIADSIGAWISNKMQVVSRHQIRSEDLTITSYIRRQAFRHFLPDYGADLPACLSIMQEVDIFLSEFDRILYSTLTSLQTEVQEQAQAIARIGNWIWDLGNDSLFWSRELFRIYELEPREPMNYNIATYNHPDDAEMVARHMAVSRETGAPHDFYYRIILPSGVEKHLHAVGQVIYNEKGEVGQMFGTLQDVTAQKMIERAQKESALFVRKITDLTPSMIAVYNIRSGEYLYINHAVKNILGYTPEEVIAGGMPFFLDIIHPADLGRIQAENQQALAELSSLSDSAASREIREFRYRLRHKNGEYRWIQTFGGIFERDGNNEVETLINISNDVTEAVQNASLVEAQTEEIARQEDRYFKMIEEVEEYAILLLSKEGIIQNWNRGAEKIKGYDAAEIVGKHMRTFYPKEDQDARLPETLIEAAARNGKSMHEGWRIRKGGARFWAYVVITALHDKQGRIIGYSKVTRDLTSRKIAEDMQRSYVRQLEEKNTELASKNKELESFTYIASHDLQEPLRKIRLWANRLEEENDLPLNARHVLSKINSSGERMQALIKSLLDYAHLDNSDRPREPIDLNALVREVTEEFADSLESRHASVDLSSLPEVSGIKTQIKQLFSNLISNAIKYARSDAPLLVRIRNNFNGRSGDGGKPYHEIVVSDNGIGFSQEYAEKIFEIFQRLEGSAAAGTGIGLAICRKILQNHGGTIRAESSPGTGTSFFIRIPA
ncbi:MAG: PAS domain-containing protein [Bacteroidota bacterium]|nr:PAS domain-containing protein [Bacteroidota bacterium]MDP4215571.1 PAS domain-containing protein [Bacteroidota bacterium]MDP4257762.1 PAS domain-containing protein [Bacteroidota bacterium]